MKEEKKDYRDIIEEARDRFDLAEDAMRDIRVAAEDDLLFVDGEGQWDEALEAQRTSAGRPCLRINKTIGFVDQVVGDQRQNRPQIKVRPVDSKSDPEVAKVLNGMIRNIENASQADIAYDHAFEHAVASSLGFFRVLTEYADDDVFEQDIKIKRISNPLSVSFDPAAKEWDCSDGMYSFITERYTKEEFKRRFPDAGVDNWDGEEFDDWFDNDEVRVCEYWRKVPVTVKIYQLRDGTVVKDLPKDLAKDPDLGVLNEREVKTHKVEWYLLNGSEVLDGPTAWAGKYIPIVPVWGKELNVKGKRKLRSLIRNTKDSQREYNYMHSTATETIALAPRVPYLVTPEQISGHEEMWRESQTKNFPYLYYNPDPEGGGRPQREASAQVPAGMLQMLEICSEELKATTGQYNPDMGTSENANQSGRALLALQHQGAKSSFAFVDNLTRSLNFLGRILVDLVPKIYDTQRVVRILGEDGKEDFIELNRKVMDPGTLKPVILNDITRGKYDVVVSTGPSYVTQRVEAASMMVEMARSWPQLTQFAGDLVAKSMDFPGAEELAKRMEKLLPPGLVEDPQMPGQQPGQPGQQQAQPQGPPQPPPDPMLKVKMAQEEIKIEQEMARLEGLKLDNMLKQKKLQEPYPLPQMPRRPMS